MDTTCVIAGGGPAGMMLGLLLARAGIEVTVVEKHGDFLRDFRGDTVHASTIRLLDELGLGLAFRALPQSRVQNFELPGRDGTLVVLGDLTTLTPPYDYVALVPQWDLLDLLAEAGRKEPTFRLVLDTEVTGLLKAADRVLGVSTRTTDGIEGEVRATLVVACDGRTSVVRRAAGLVSRAYRVPFDTWWFRLPRHPAEQERDEGLRPVFDAGQILLSIPRTSYFQLAYFTAKGDDARLRAEGVERFRARIAHLRPDLADRVEELASMDDVHMLDVKLDRLRRWYRPGLLCLGDAAHAMSPAGGVGINLAIQDAVAAATLLAEPLRRGRLTTADLARVQHRRWWPTVVLQTGQRLLHRVIFAPLVAGRVPRAPQVARVLATRVPGFTRVPAQLIAFGPRPEHAPDFARRP
ncbi:MAG: FAD-dependent oxidoreductase [Propionibacteriaceae bacterium]